VNRHEISADQVESVLVTSYSETLHFVGRHYTTTESTYVDAHLSLPYAVAVAIADAEYGWRQQSSGRIADPAVHDLASRVTVDVDESMDETYPDDWPVRVEITLKDGRKVADRLDKVTGCPNRPMTDSELCGKFVGNVEGVIGADRAEGARDTFMGLESLGSAPELVGLLAPTA
jgi:2-methylcitrate dehydratase PrpD